MSQACCFALAGTCCHAADAAARPLRLCVQSSAAPLSNKWHCNKQHCNKRHCNKLSNQRHCTWSPASSTTLLGNLPHGEVISCAIVVMHEALPSAPPGGIWVVGICCRLGIARMQGCCPNELMADAHSHGCAPSAASSAYGARDCVCSLPPALEGTGCVHAEAGPELRACPPCCACRIIPNLFTEISASKEVRREGALALCLFCWQLRYCQAVHRKRQSTLASISNRRGVLHGLRRRTPT